MASHNSPVSSNEVRQDFVALVALTLPPPSGRAVSREELSMRQRSDKVFKGVTASLEGGFLEPNFL